MKNIKINKISKRNHSGKVFNLELESSRKDELDDLFWIEQSTGIISHNCFPKDINALISTFYENDLDPMLLKAAWEENLKIRDKKYWDWAESKSAVLEKEEENK